MIDGFRKNETEMPGISNTVIDLLDRGWHYATLFFGETQIRTGHILVGGAEVARAAPRASRRSRRNSARSTSTRWPTSIATIWAGSEEENLRPMDGSGLRARRNAGRGAAAGRARARRRSTASRRT